MRGNSWLIWFGVAPPNPFEFPTGIVVCAGGLLWHFATNLVDSLPRKARQGMVGERI